MKFKQALEELLVNEGGYVHNENDAGGETYKGIARNYQAAWEGWQTIDVLKEQAAFPANLEDSESLQEQVEQFYRKNFWDPLKPDQINSQKVAFSIFDFGVNAGVRTSAKLAQGVIGTVADGIIGPNTLAKFNAFNEDHFLAAFTLAKIQYYADLVDKKPTNKQFFFGWVKRAIMG